MALQARRELQALLILAEAGAAKMSFKLVPCAYANYGRLCAEATIDGKPLAAHMIALVDRLRPALPRGKCDEMIAHPSD